MPTLLKYPAVFFETTSSFETSLRCGSPHFSRISAVLLVSLTTHLPQRMDSADAASGKSRQNAVAKLWVRIGFLLRRWYLTLSSFAASGADRRPPRGAA